MHISPVAWLNMDSRNQFWVSHGTEQDSDRTGQYGEESFYCATIPRLGESPPYTNFDCRVATFVCASHGGSLSLYCMKSLARKPRVMTLPSVNSLGATLGASLVELLEKDINSPTTTSMGRLFDGISSILGLRHVSTFEGEAAMALEFASEQIENEIRQPSHRPLRFPSLEIPMIPG